MYSARILADSLSPDHIRLVTFEVTFPRFILAELNTHRMLSRNSASSRAIPTEKLLEQVENNPFIPEFNNRVKGMGVGEPLFPGEQAYAGHVWLAARDEAVKAAKSLLNVDKSRVNRLLEPFMWHTALVSATDWTNFFALRTHPDAQPEFRTIATMMRDLYHASEPWYCPAECWHLPLVGLDELGAEPDYAYWKQVSSGRCARVSYLTHDGKRDSSADIGLHNRLIGSGHFSPLEHVARPFTTKEWEAIREEQEDMRDFLIGDFPKEIVNNWCRQLEYCGNTRGWKQYRSEIPNQHDFSLAA